MPQVDSCSWPNWRTLSVTLPRSTSTRWPAPKLRPPCWRKRKTQLSALRAASVPSQVSGGFRQLSQLGQGPHAPLRSLPRGGSPRTGETRIRSGPAIGFAEVLQQPHAAAVVRLGQRQQRVELAALQALEVPRRRLAFVDHAALVHHVGQAVGHPGVGAGRRGRRGRSPGSSPRCSWAGPGARRSARRACRCPCRRRWWPPSRRRRRAGSGPGGGGARRRPARRGRAARRSLRPASQVAVSSTFLRLWR